MRSWPSAKRWVGVRRRRGWRGGGQGLWDALAGHWASIQTRMHMCEHMQAWSWEHVHTFTRSFEMACVLACSAPRPWSRSSTAWPPSTGGASRRAARSARWGLHVLHFMHGLGPICGRGGAGAGMHSLLAAVCPTPDWLACLLVLPRTALLHP